MNKFKNHVKTIKDWAVENQDWLVIAGSVVVGSVAGLYLYKEFKKPIGIKIIEPEVVEKVVRTERYLYQTDDCDFGWMAIVSDRDEDGNLVDLNRVADLIKEGKFREE